MASPEFIGQNPPPPEVQQIPEQVRVPEGMEQIGVSATQVQAQPLQTPQGQVLAQPVAPSPVPPIQDAPTIQIPAVNEAQLEQMSHGNPDDQATWFGEFWLRKVKQAVQSGVQAIFGQNG